jgi:methylase of polypeptide subunit release factors
VKGDYSESEFEKLIEKDLTDLKEDSIASLLELYEKIKELEKEGKNRIWTRLLKNSFAPLLMGKFDFVVGNPPWVNWECLPEHYRENTRKLWDYYGLLERTKGMGLGKVKRDMAMLFTARCIDRYLKVEGRFSFLIPFTVYKTQAGAGFRKFLVKGYWKDKKANSPCKVLKVHDLVTLYPFEGAINRTSLIVIEKKGETEFPIPCVMWNNPRSRGMPQEAELEEVKKTTKQFDMILAPIRKGKANVNMPWMITGENAYDTMLKVMKSSRYRAHAGVYTGVNSAYWITIESKQAAGILIKNLATIGKRKVKEIKTIIEPELIYPLVRGQDHKAWHVTPSGYILIPTDDKGKTLSHSELKIEYSKTYQYFLNFLEDLANRGGQPYKSKLETYRKKPIDEAERKAPPFYWLFNVAPALAPYKVMWKYVAGKISGKGEFSVAVAEPVEDEHLGKKVIIPNEKLMLIPFDDRDEAHYVASVLNSSVAQLIVMGYTIETAISTHVVKNVYVPKFNPKDKVYLRLAELSKKAHALAKRYYEQKDLEAQEELKEVEVEVDKAVAGLYGITDEELEEVKKTLRVLRGGEK